MAQVMINFRVDEDTKRDMELACKSLFKIWRNARQARIFSLGKAI